MASKRRVRRKQCQGKRRHETLAEAIQEARRLGRFLHWSINSYACQFCGGYHNGHAKNRATRARLKARGAIV